MLLTTRFIIAIWYAAVCLCARAEYRILYLNTPEIEIGGKILKVHDTFKAGAPVRWTSPRQAMKVVDTDTGRRSVFVADDFSKAKATSVQGYLDGTKASAAAKPGSSPLPSLAAYLNDSFYLLGSLEIETGVPTDTRHYFFISYDHGGQEIAKAVHNDNGTISFTPGVFSFNGSRPSREIKVKVYYYDKNADKVITVCDNMRIVILPGKLK